MTCTTCRRFLPQGVVRCPACGTGVVPAARAAQARAVAAASLVNQAAVSASAPHGTAVACPAPHRHPQTAPSPSAAPQRPAQAAQPASSAAPAASPPTPRVAARPVDPQVLPEGTTLAGGRYWLGPLLGRGSFGITYRGLDQRLDRPVAIKEFFPEGAYRQGSGITPPASLGRQGYEAERDHFIQEARVLAKFQRPGIVRVYEVFEENDTAYMVMEYLEGRTLADVLRVRGGPLPIGDALRYVLAVADALAAVHEQHLLHRDVKPGNIMVTPAPRDEAVLIDFGAARRYDRYQRTSVMTAIGTPGYAPLEQWGSSGRFGPASDVYALAATLYHLVTGRMPPSAADRAIGDTLEPPSALNRSVSQPVSEAIVAGLAVRMEERPQTMAAFAALLRGARRSRPGPGGGAPQANRSAGPAMPAATAPPPRQLASAPRPAAEASQPAVRSLSLPAAPQPNDTGATRPRGLLRARWPRRRRSQILWAGASPFAPLFFCSSIVTVTTVLPVLTVLAVACTGELRLAARASLRATTRFAGWGMAACGISTASALLVAGLTLRGVLRTTLSWLA